MFPSKDENTFLICELWPFLVIATMDGPLPEIVALNARFCINFKINLGSEFKMDEAARPLSIDAFQ